MINKEIYDLFEVSLPSSVRSTRAEMTLAKVVLSIVLTFLVCQVPRIYLQSYRVTQGPGVSIDELFVLFTVSS